MGSNSRSGISTRRTAARAWVLVLVLAGLAVVVWSSGVSRMAPAAPSARVSWLVLALAFAASEALAIHFDFRNEGQILTLSEIPLAVGLVFVAPVGLLVASLVGSATAAFRRRQRPSKAIFNLANQALTTAAAVVAFHFALGEASPVSARGWLAVLAAVLAADAVSYGCVVLVIWLTAGRPRRDALLQLALAAAVVVATNSTLALLAICVLWVNLAAGWLLVFVGAVFGIGYRADAALRRRYANLNVLYGFTRNLSAASTGSTDLETVILTEAMRMLRAEEAELAIVVPGGFVIVSASVDEPSFRRNASEPCGLIRTVLDRDEALVVPRDRRDGPLSALLEERHWRDALATPVAGEGGPAGALLVANRLGDNTTFDVDDLRLFEALANHASVALRNDQLLDRLRQQALAREHQALHDALTGLANRTLFSERVDAACQTCTPDGMVTVLLMDLDQFKEVNDTLGHHTGDALLRETANRLVKVVGTRGLVARLGGDEFAVVLPGTRSVLESVSIAADIRSAIEQPLAIEDLVLEVPVSVGVAIAPQHGTDASTLLQRADVAMYTAKASRSGVEVYAVERDSYSPRRLALVSELRQAIETGEIAVFYQPKASLPGGQVFGVEALARWFSPRHGMVPPDEFIPLAEQTGLIRPLTLLVMTTALEQVAAWRAKGIELSIAMNLSARSLLDVAMADDILNLVRRTGVPASSVILELTESSVMADPNRSLVVWNALAAIGVQLSIDDFGTGYSSLSRLRRLPVDEVKIDKSFVLNMINDASDEAIVRSTIDLARNLGLRAVAEGVEDWGTWDRLARLGCAVAQGYLLSPALPAPELEEWLVTWNRRPFRPRLVNSRFGADRNGHDGAEEEPRLPAHPVGR